MEQLVNFFLEHFFLSSSFLTVLFLIIYLELTSVNKYITNVTPQELVTLINIAGTKVIDTRSSDKFKKGSILNSENIFIDELHNTITTTKKYKNKKIIFVNDLAKSPSNKLMESLNKAGQKDLYVLKGGMDAWIKAEMPVVKKDN